MTKREFELLERIFAAEMDDGVPVKRKGKLVQKLLEDQLIQLTRIVLSGRFPVIIDGFVLTNRGHVLFCEECFKRAVDE